MANLVSCARGAGRCRVAVWKDASDHADTHDARAKLDKPRPRPLRSQDPTSLQPETDTVNEIEVLMIKYAALAAQNQALATVLGTLAGRMAREHRDSEQFIMTLTAPLSAMAEAFDPDDAMGEEAAGSILELQEHLEDLALSIARR